MNYKDMVTFEELKALINSALADFYTNDSVLLDYNTEDKAVAERCMVFHIGWYIISRIKGIPSLSWANVDCEYNRNFNHPKSMYEITLAGIQKKIKDAVPDLLIHQRRSNENNLLVVEFKKGTPSDTLFLNDEEKLIYFTDAQNEYKYSFGLYIELHKNTASVKVYQGGKHKSHLDYRWAKT